MTSPTRALPVKKKPETVKEGSFLRLAKANRRVLKRLAFANHRYHTRSLPICQVGK